MKNYVGSNPFPRKISHVSYNISRKTNGAYLIYRLGAVGAHFGLSEGSEGFDGESGNASWNVM
jgi:hypothetical protein